MEIFHKYHALGNDYLVLDSSVVTEPPEAVLIERICHRNFGLGSDGILFGPLVSDKADFGLRIFNPDGSEAEKSGNGLRIFVRYLFDNRKVSTQPFTVETLGGIVCCQILDEKANAIQIDMGEVHFAMDHIPMGGAELGDRELGEVFELDGAAYTAYIADIGNPHCVLPMSTISADLAKRLGPQLECHQRFPNRTNVQLLRVIDRNTIEIEIWERGAGYTLASGSSSSAAAAVAHRIGLCDKFITVKMPGGELTIEIGANFAVRMTGPVTKVGTFYLDSEALSV